MKDNKSTLNDNITVTQKASIYEVRVAAVVESKVNKALNIPIDESYMFYYISLKGEVPSEKECLTRFHKGSLKSGAFRVVSIKLVDERFVSVEDLKEAKE